MSNIEEHKSLVPIYVNNLNDPKLFIGTETSHIKPT